MIYSTCVQNLSTLPSIIPETWLAHLYSRLLVLIHVSKIADTVWRFSSMYLSRAVKSVKNISCQKYPTPESLRQTERICNNPCSLFEKNKTCFWYSWLHYHCRPLQLSSRRSGSIMVPFLSSWSLTVRPTWCAEVIFCAACRWSPSGSMFGPILFIMYTAGLPNRADWTAWLLPAPLCICYPDRPIILWPPTVRHPWVIYKSVCRRAWPCACLHAVQSASAEYGTMSELLAGSISYQGLYSGFDPTPGGLKLQEWPMTELSSRLTSL